MKIFEKLFAGKSSRNRALISYGRGPEGEEVMIDITESRRINVTVIIAFLIILPLVMLLFSAIYGTESLKVTSANYFPKGWCIILVGLLLGVLMNWLLQAVVYLIIHPWSYRKFAVRFNRHNHTVRFFYEGDLKVIHFRVANILAHCVCGYIPLLAGFIIGDVSVCYLGVLSIMYFLDETSLVWRLRHYSGQAMCRYKVDKK